MIKFLKVAHFNNDACMSSSWQYFTACLALIPSGLLPFCKGQNTGMCVEMQKQSNSRLVYVYISFQFSIAGDKPKALELDC